MIREIFPCDLLFDENTDLQVDVSLFKLDVMLLTVLLQVVLPARGFYISVGYSATEIA